MLSIIILENVRIGTTSKWNISLDKKTVCKDHFRSSVLFKPWNSGSDFKHALTQQPAMHRIETTVES